MLVSFRLFCHTPNRELWGESKGLPTLTAEGVPERNSKHERKKFGLFLRILEYGTLELDMHGTQTIIIAAAICKYFALNNLNFRGRLLLYGATEDDKQQVQNLKAGGTASASDVLRAILLILIWLSCGWFCIKCVIWIWQDLWLESQPQFLCRSNKIGQELWEQWLWEQRSNNTGTDCGYIQVHESLEWCLNDWIRREDSVSDIAAIV